MKDFKDSTDSKKGESNVLSDPDVTSGESKEVAPTIYTVYILRSSSNQLYIGQTNNLHNREKQQITKSQKSAKFIRDGDDWQLVYSEQYNTRVDAMRREKQVKGWTRVKKEALISGDLKSLKKL